jgi:hypothetical protein
MRVSIPMEFWVPGFGARRKGEAGRRGILSVIIWLGLVEASQGRRNKKPTAFGRRWVGKKWVLEPAQLLSPPRWRIAQTAQRTAIERELVGGRLAMVEWKFMERQTF